MMYLKHIQPSPNSSHNHSFVSPIPSHSLEISSFCLSSTLSWEWDMGMCVVVTAIQKWTLLLRQGWGFMHTTSHFHAGILTGSSQPGSSACCRNHHIHMCNRPAVSGKHCFLDFSNYLWLLESFQHLSLPPPLPF